MFFYEKLNFENCSLNGFNFALKVMKLALKYRHELFSDEVLKLICTKFGILGFLSKFLPYIWTISGKNGDFIGFAYLYGVQKNVFKDEIDSCFLTVCLERKHWGTGVFDIAKDFLTKIRNKYKIRKIKAECFSTNSNAVGILEKMGFEIEAIFKKETIVKGKIVDIKIFSKFYEV